MMLPQLPEISHVIQLAVAPVFLLTGVGAIIGVLSNRLARIVDRARGLEQDLVGGAAVAGAAIRTELDSLLRRARLIHLAIVLATLCALLVTLLISTAFVGAFVTTNVSAAVAVMFVGAMFAFSGALLVFLREIFIATSTLRFGIEEAERVERR